MRLEHSGHQSAFRGVWWLIAVASMCMVHLGEEYAVNMVIGWLGVLSSCALALGGDTGFETLWRAASSTLVKFTT